MKQTEDHKKYASTFNKLESKEDRAVLDLNSKIADAESSIGFHIWLFEETNRMFPIKKTRMPLKMYRQIIYHLYLKNCDYLLSSMILAKYGLVNSAYSNLRTVYENILMIYYLRFHPNEAGLIFSSSRIKIASKQKKKLKTKKYYSTSFLLDALYKPRMKSMMKTFYHQISMHSHPSVWNANLDQSYKPKTVTDCLNGILALTYGSVTSFLEEVVFLFDDTQRKGINESRLRILDSLGSKYDFAPNATHLAKELRIKGDKIT